MTSEDLKSSSDNNNDRCGLVRLFNETRKRLIETGTRNRLVHVNRANTRGNNVNIVNERSNEIYGLLSSGKTMRFHALGKDKSDEASEIQLIATASEEVSEDRLTDNLLETRMGPNALQKRLLKVYLESKTAEQESGINILYLALGFITWFEDKSSSLPRESPLILLPVDLVRNARTSTYDLRFREDEIVTNLPLQQRLKEDFGISLPDVEIWDDWKPSDYFSAIEQIVETRDRWKVDRDGIQLGFFSFSKLLMFRDLAVETWPDGALADHALTKGLLYEGFESEPPLFGSEDRLDEVLPPQKLFHVVDADASQAKVIEEVRSGRNLVVQGPPGTGKSQTITNIIAAAVSEGKRVLFVAEKKAALSVVHDRLIKVGLKDICLELHSRSANKKSVLDELARTLNQASEVPSPSAPPTALRDSRDRLNDLAAVLHRPIRNTGESPYSLLGRQSLLIGKGVPPPMLDAECLSSMSREDEKALLAIILDYGVTLAEEGRGVAHPFEGTRNLELQPVELERLRSNLSDAQINIATLASTLGLASEALGLTGKSSLNGSTPLIDLLKRIEGMPSSGAAVADEILKAFDISRFRPTLSAGASWRAIHDEATGLFADAAFAARAQPLNSPLSEEVDSTPIALGLAEAKVGVGRPSERALNLDLDPVELARVSSLLLDAQGKLSELASVLRLSFDALGLTGTSSLNHAAPLIDLLKRIEGLPTGSVGVPTAILKVQDVSRLRQVLAAGASWREAHDDAAGVFVGTAFATQTEHLRSRLVTGTHSFFARWGGGYRGTSRELDLLLKGELPKSAAERVGLVDRLSAVSALKEEWNSDRDYCARILGDDWSDDRTDFAKLLGITEWCEHLSRATITPSWDKAIALACRPEAVAEMRKALEDARPVAASAMQEVLKLLDLDPGLLGEDDFESSDLNEIATRLGMMARTHSFFARWGGGYRGASRELALLLKGELPKSAAERVGLVDRLSAVSALKEAWNSDRDYCARILGDVWADEKTDFGKLLAITEWCEHLSRTTITPSWDKAIALACRPEAVAEMRRALEDTQTIAANAMQGVIKLLDLDQGLFEEGDFESSDLGEIAARLEMMANATDCYQAWARRARLQKALEAAGLASLEARMRRGDLSGDEAASELRYARAESLWKRALTQQPELHGLSQVQRHELVATFTMLERDRFKDNVSQILSTHLGQLPQGATGMMGIIRGEIGKKTKRIALRRLFERAGEAVQRIKPVLLMSPISIAQFIPPGCLKFDLLLIDEASQVRPEDALGAIARAEQIVVVGDKKQLPPTSFFDRLLDDDEDQEGKEDGADDLLGGAASVASMESILTLCEARGLGTRMLNWHYRSRDPSLIEVSNREFYENSLILPPSPLQNDPAYGLCFTRVDGNYDRGGKRDNRKEAEAVVDRAAQHAQLHQTLSLGIVTFSFAQRNLITELLEFRRRTDTVLDAFLREGQSEDVFVKNIENVQGDERDVILVSVGYGPSSPGGRPGMSFGPVNGDGGERRLNVLFTRARVRCEVFASFDPGDMDVSRASQQGPRILKRFLEFAKHGVIEENIPTGEEADSPFEEDVADVIKSLGFLADPQVGSSGFRIDIGVRHPDKPGTYLLAVECDGATYHSALWARERDRLRQDVLEHLGWRFHRIWSTDWFYNRTVEVDRLRVGLEAAREAAAQGVRIDGANKDSSVSAIVEEVPRAFDLPEAIARQMPAYARAIFPVHASYEPHEAPMSLLSELVWKIVEAEGPIHVDEVARRISASYGKEKAGSRIIKAAGLALALARENRPDLTSQANFWFTVDQSKTPPVRDRSQESGATLKAAAISMLEIREALRLAREDNAGGDDAELVRSAARMMGFKRVGPELQVRIATGL